NLRERGFDVVIGLRPGKYQEKAEEDGFTVLPFAEAVKQAQVTMVLLPDENQASVYKESIEENLQEGSAFAFAHGFNIHYSQIQPPKNVDGFLVAPKGPGQLVRRTYEDGAGVPALFGVFQY